MALVWEYYREIPMRAAGKVDSLLPDLYKTVLSVA